MGLKLILINFWRTFVEIDGHDFVEPMQAILIIKKDHGPYLVFILFC
jgi:hypothetical protein